jgi:hypothetical protein
MNTGTNFNRKNKGLARGMAQSQGPELETPVLSEKEGRKEKMV